MLNSRASCIGFAERTEANLRFMQKAFEAGDDVHMITQVVNSLLGLVVFPWEKNFFQAMERRSLTQLDAEGWPRWTIKQGHCTTLWELIRFVRNGTSHGHIEFSSDSRHLPEVEIHVANYPRFGELPNFVAAIRADHLLDFCIRFSRLAVGIIG